MKKISVILALFCSSFIFGQDIRINPDLFNNYWPAQWIMHPTASPTEYGVFHFRKSFQLNEVPGEFIVHVSADNRYRLFVNGEPVGIGPARGDLDNWRYESYDIAPHLNEGPNVLAATVWNFGIHIPYAQFTAKTAFILQGNSETEEVVNTDDSWKVLENEGYKPETESHGALNTFIVVGPGDQVDGSRYPWGWKEQDYDDSEWLNTRSYRLGYPRGFGTGHDWMLVPRKIPLMEASTERMDRIRRTTGVEITEQLLGGNNPVTIAPDQSCSFLIDNGHLTTAYPELILSGGAGSTITLTYCEALFDANGQKGHRDSVENKKVIGYKDIFYPDGGDDRKFRPLWLRTYRYILVEIETKDQALTLNDFFGQFTGYPFEDYAVFQADKPILNDIWDVGWRTARLCAGETYYDCPYYEQLQYVGDTRIQALISLYVSGDDRLMRRAIEDFNDSRLPNGLTQSRYPSSIKQLIPPYSLFWISMVYDYWMHRDDPDFVKSFLPGIEGVIGWYERQIVNTGMFREMKWWHFVDWAEEWPWNPDKRIGGVPNNGNTEHLAVLSLHFAYTLEQVSKLFEGFGDLDRSLRYKEEARLIKQSVIALCWDEDKELVADTPEKNTFSQHTNIFAILSDAVHEDRQPVLMEKIMSDSSLIQTTFYFRFYLFQALKKVGMADQYISQLKPWEDMLNKGLTTFAEKPDPTRSDCHAWSASPNYDLLATVAGIRPGAPGFKMVRISPSFGDLTRIKAEMPHPDGTISLDLEKKRKRVRGTITLPEGINGLFFYNDQLIQLRPGLQEINEK